MRNLIAVALCAVAIVATSAARADVNKLHEIRSENGIENPVTQIIRYDQSNKKQSFLLESVLRSGDKRPQFNTHLASSPPRSIISDGSKFGDFIVFAKRHKTDGNKLSIAGLGHDGKWRLYQGAIASNLKVSLGVDLGFIENATLVTEVYRTARKTIVCGSEASVPVVWIFDNQGGKKQRPKKVQLAQREGLATSIEATVGGFLVTWLDGMPSEGGKRSASIASLSRTFDVSMSRVIQGSGGVLTTIASKVWFVSVNGDSNLIVRRLGPNLQDESVITAWARNSSVTSDTDLLLVGGEMVIVGNTNRALVASTIEDGSRVIRTSKESTPERVVKQSLYSINTENGKVYVIWLSEDGQKVIAEIR